MRFVLFDRIVELQKGRGAVFLKNITQSEDYFIDHFPGFPVVPGSILIGCFAQGGEILLGATHEFTLRPILQRVTRVRFRHFVTPGDQLEVRLTLDPAVPFKVRAAAQIQDKRVADGELDFTLQDPNGDPKLLEACRRLERFYELFKTNPLNKVWNLWDKSS